MEKSTISLKINNLNHRENAFSFKCEECNGTFPKPILATVSSHGSVQTYQACPRCLSKVSNIQSYNKEKNVESSILAKNVKKTIEAKHEKSITCKHFLGYLKKRSKGMPIPDECLTCDKMIECLVH